MGHLVRPVPPDPLGHPGLWDCPALWALPGQLDLLEPPDLSAQLGLWVSRGQEVPLVPLALPELPDLEV